MDMNQLADLYCSTKSAEVLDLLSKEIIRWCTRYAQGAPDINIEDAEEIASSVASHIHQGIEGHCSRESSPSIIGWVIHQAKFVIRYTRQANNAQKRKTDIVWLDDEEYLHGEEAALRVFQSHTDLDIEDFCKLFAKTARETGIVKMRAKGYVYDEIGEVYGISRPTAQRVVERVIKRSEEE